MLKCSEILKMYHGIISRESKSSMIISLHGMQSRGTFDSQIYAFKVYIKIAGRVLTQPAM
jgi:hypothetical protein